MGNSVTIKMTIEFLSVSFLFFDRTRLRYFIGCFICELDSESIIFEYVVLLEEFAKY